MVPGVRSHAFMVPGVRSHVFMVPGVRSHAFMVPGVRSHAFMVTGVGLNGHIPSSQVETNSHFTIFVLGLPNYTIVLLD